MSKKERERYKRGEIDRIKERILDYAKEQDYNNIPFSFPSRCPGKQDDDNSDIAKLFNLFRDILETNSISNMRNAMRELISEGKIKRKYNKEDPFKHNYLYYINNDHYEFEYKKGDFSIKNEYIEDDDWNYKDEIKWKEDMKDLDKCIYDNGMPEEKWIELLNEENNSEKEFKSKREDMVKDWYSEEEINKEEINNNVVDKIFNNIIGIIERIRSNDINEFQEILDNDRKKNSDEYFRVLNNYENSILEKDKEICNLKDILSEHETIRQRMVTERGKFLSRIRELESQVEEKEAGHEFANKTIIKLQEEINNLKRKRRNPEKNIQNKIKELEKIFIQNNDNIKFKSLKDILK